MSVDSIHVNVWYFDLVVENDDNRGSWNRYFIKVKITVSLEVDRIPHYKGVELAIMFGWGELKGRRQGVCQMYFAVAKPVII